MRRLVTTSFAVLAITAGFAADAAAQSLSDRIEQVRRQRQAQQQQEAHGQTRPSVAARLRQPLGEASIDDVPAREAFNWLGDLTGINFVINWDRLDMAGVDGSAPVTVPAGLTTAAALDLIVSQLEEFEPVIWNATPWYVQVMTKEQANRRSVMRIYPIDDLLMEVPHFDNAPSFDLTEITRGDQGGGAGGGGGGGGQGIFDDQGQQNQQEIGLTREDRAMELADLIRDTVEPDIWRSSGGDVGSIRYYQGSLIIRAPEYVHREIGGSGSLRPISQPRLPSQSLVPAAGGGGGRYVDINVRGGQSEVNQIREVPLRGQPPRRRGSRNAGIAPPRGSNAGIR